MDRLPAEYRNAAVCVIPSLYENFPNTCIEAMACGYAVVASAVGGIPEIITHGVDGLLVAPGRPDALAAAICPANFQSAAIARARQASASNGSTAF